MTELRRLLKIDDPAAQNVCVPELDHLLIQSIIFTVNLSCRNLFKVDQSALQCRASFCVKLLVWYILMSKTSSNEEGPIEMIAFSNIFANKKKPVLHYSSNCSMRELL